MLRVWRTPRVLLRKIQMMRKTLLKSRIKHSFACIIWSLFIQLIHFVFHVAMFLPITQLHCSRCKPRATCNSLIRSDEGLTLETSAFNFSAVPNYLVNFVDKSKVQDLVRSILDYKPVSLSTRGQPRETIKRESAKTGRNVTSVSSRFRPTTLAARHARHISTRWAISRARLLVRFPRLSLSQKRDCSQSRLIFLQGTYS